MGWVQLAMPSVEASSAGQSHWDSGEQIRESPIGMVSAEPTRVDEELLFQSQTIVSEGETFRMSQILAALPSLCGAEIRSAGAAGLGWVQIQSLSSFGMVSERL